MKKKVLALLLAVSCGMSLAACGSNSTEPAGSATPDTKADSSVLTMATNAEFPPFEYVEEGKVVGVDADIAEAIAEKLGRKLEITNIDFDAALTGAATGKYDVAIAGITATDERKANMNFSDDYYTASQAIIVTADSDIKKADDLKGKVVACQEGTTGEQYLLDNDYEVQSFKTGAEAVAALTSGKADAVVIDDQVAKALSEKQDGKTVVLDEAMTQETYAIAMKKGNDELTAEINAALKDLKDSGKLAEIFQKYELPFDAE